MYQEVVHAVKCDSERTKIHFHLGKKGLPARIEQDYVTLWCIKMWGIFNVKNEKVTEDADVQAKLSRGGTRCIASGDKGTLLITRGDASPAADAAASLLTLEESETMRNETNFAGQAATRQNSVGNNGGSFLR